jgi:hypothetical protein
MKKIIPFLIGFLFGLVQISAAETLINDTTFQYQNKTISSLFTLREKFCK